MERPIGTATYPREIDIKGSETGTVAESLGGAGAGSNPMTLTLVAVLALTGSNPMTLTLIAVLAMGASTLLTGSSFADPGVRALRLAARPGRPTRTGRRSRRCPGPVLFISGVSRRGFPAGGFPPGVSRRGPAGAESSSGARALLVAQRLDGVELRRFSRGVESEEDPHAGGKSQGHGNGGGRNHRDPTRDPGHDR